MMNKFEDSFGSNSLRSEVVAYVSAFFMYLSRLDHVHPGFPRLSMAKYTGIQKNMRQILLV